jgi:hypothetical protein
LASSPTAIRRAIEQTRRLLDERGTAIEPVTPPTPLIHLTTKTKPTC